MEILKPMPFLVLLLVFHPGMAAVPKLLVVALDGLRYDFITEEMMPNLVRLAKEGVWAVEGVTPVFPTETTPNFAALATGLFPESSGILGNKMRTKHGNLVYDLWVYANASGDVQEHSKDPSWYKGVPFWTLNDRLPQRATGSHFWPLSEVHFNGAPTPQRLVPYHDGHDTKDSWLHDADTVLEWFDEGINLGLLYIAYPDEAEHGHPIESDRIASLIHDLDDVIGHIANHLRDDSSHFKLNLVILSDHGHVTVDPATGVTEMQPILPELVDGLDFYPPGLYAKHGENIDWEHVYIALKMHETDGHYTVYKRDEIPEYFHIRKHEYTTDLIVVPEAGYYLDFGKALKKKTGRHGAFSNRDKEMRASFVAVGPAFKQGISINEPFNNVDIYALICAVLELHPPPNNGSLRILESALVDTASSWYWTFPRPSVSKGLLFSLCVLSACSFLGFSWFTLRLKRRVPPMGYARAALDDDSDSV